MWHEICAYTAIADVVGVVVIFTPYTVCCSTDSHTHSDKHKYKVRNERVINNHFSNWYANKFHVRGRAPATPYTHTDTHPQRERCECLRGAWGYRCVNFRRIVFSLISKYTHTHKYTSSRRHINCKYDKHEPNTERLNGVALRRSHNQFLHRNDQIDARPGISFFRFQPDSGCLIIVIMLSFRN